LNLNVLLPNWHRKLRIYQAWVRTQAVHIAEAVERLNNKNDKLVTDIYSTASRAQVCQLSRHPDRPYILDYIPHMFDDFQELHGDRAFADDGAIVGGLANFRGRSVMVVGHQKGRDTKEKLKRNFGMPRPEGYRKALRLFKLAVRFEIPVLTFIDTAGARPGLDAEERGQRAAIAYSLFLMSRLKTPIISVVIGEGGSGGALAIGVCDRLLMLQFSIYSVISPEGCASILWKSAERAEDAAEAMGITAERIKSLGLIDNIVAEPLRGAHRDYLTMGKRIKERLAKDVDALEQ